MIADFRESQEDQIKKIANFDPDKEPTFNGMSIFGFLFHIRALHRENSKD